MYIAYPGQTVIHSDNFVALLVGGDYRTTSMPNSTTAGSSQSTAKEKILPVVSESIFINSLVTIEEASAGMKRSFPAAASGWLNRLSCRFKFVQEAKGTAVTVNFDSGLFLVNIAIW